MLILCCLAPIEAADIVPRGVIASVERNMDDRVSRLWADNPLILMGPTRGVYLEGYGAVFTVEVNMVIGLPVATPLGRQVEDKDQIAKFREKKLARLDELKSALRKTLVDTAASLDPLPADQQLVLVAFLSRYPWEDTSGLPVQLTVRGSKKKLLEMLRAPAGSNAEAAIPVIQY